VKHVLFGAALALFVVQFGQNWTWYALVALRLAAT
jgi:hypothetical protein